MSKRRAVAIATLLAVQGCAAGATLRIPLTATAKASAGMAVPETGTTLAPKTPTAAKPPVTAAKTAPVASVLQIPADVAVRLPASLIGEGASKVISNDGGSVVSNDGGSVVSNDGGSFVTGGKGFGLLEMAPVPDGTPTPVPTLGEAVADYFHGMSKMYARSVEATNLLLSVGQDQDNLAQLLAGKRVTLQIPAVDPDAGAVGVLTFAVELDTKRAQPVLRAYSGTTNAVEIMRLTFTDKDHGEAYFHGDKGLVPGADNPFDFHTTFDRVKNRATVDAYFDNSWDFGHTRLHLTIGRPDKLVPGGPTLELHVVTASRGGQEVAEGITDATAYALPDGSSAAIMGARALGATTNKVDFQGNPDLPASDPHPYAFFIDHGGKPIKAPPAGLSAIVPPSTDVLPLLDDVDKVDYKSDAIFKFPD